MSLTGDHASCGSSRQRVGGVCLRLVTMLRAHLVGGGYICLTGDHALCESVKCVYVCLSNYKISIFTCSAKGPDQHNRIATKGDVIGLTRKEIFLRGHDNLLHQRS